MVTGAGGGVGSALVRLFGEEGARVVAVDLSEERLAALEVPGDAEVEIVCADVGTRDSADRILEASSWDVDVLVNNAGLIEIQTVDEIDDELWDRVFAVNLHGPYRLCKRAVPIMVAKGWGRIVNISSAAGLRGGRAGVAYTASKYGLIGLTQNIAATFADAGIRCNAVCPGGIQTGFSTGAPRSDRAVRVATSHPGLTREEYATPDQVASVAVFLARPESSHINGVALPVDNGWLAM